MKMRTEPTLFEKSCPNTNGAHYTPKPTAAAADWLGGEAGDLLAAAPPALPELGELQVVRHYTRLAQRNFSIDANFYPLGSCTMKYNPRVNEWAAAQGGLADLHPLAPAQCAQGALRLMYELRCFLAEIAGLHEVTLTPAAGAHGELTALKVITAYHRSRGQNRQKVLTPDSSHGTNPASCTLCGRNAVPVKSRPDGRIDLEDLARRLDDDTAALMITNPNTLGLFERDILPASELLHRAGAQLYLDGANMNAIMGIARPGDFGVDAMHFNLHKTFSTPHGGGGPGAGPVAVAKHLSPFLPVPQVEQAKDGSFRLNYDRGDSIGMVRSFAGQFGVLVRAWTYIRGLGANGIRCTSETAVLNANYLRAALRKLLPLPYDGYCMHEFVLSALRSPEDRGLAGKIAKRLIDFGIHPPTVYFPLIVPEALMVEPTETESLDVLDNFIEVMGKIVEELEKDPAALDHAPHDAPVARVDEIAAARNPILRWK